MSVRVSLESILEAMEFQSREDVSYLNKKTGKIVTVTGDEAIDDDDVGDLMDISDWDQGLVAKAQQDFDSDDYVELPPAFDIHEYNIMEHFCFSLKDTRIQEKLLEAIQGRGAFRRFKDRIQRYGVEDDWFTYRGKALREIAIQWCKANNIEFEE